MKRFLILGLLAACTPTAMTQTATAQDSGETRIADRDLKEMMARLPGVYSNAEQVYFQDNLELDAASHVPALFLTIEADGDGFIAKTRTLNSDRTTQARLSYFVEDGQIVSRETRAGQPDCRRRFTRRFEQFQGVPLNETESCGGVVIADPHGFAFGAPGRELMMRRTNPFKCWVAPQKRDGSYGFVNDVALHDGGEGVWVEGEAFDTVGLRIRHVRWPAGNNRDSLVLYVHKADDTGWEKAESYGWTSPDEPRLGLNLRWVQVSCTRGEIGATPSINLKTGSGK